MGDSVPEKKSLVTPAQGQVNRGLNRMNTASTKSLFNETSSRIPRGAPLLKESDLGREIATVLHKIPALKINKLFFQNLFASADKGNEGTLSRKEILDLVSYMNLPFSYKQLEEYFDYYDKDGNGTLSPDEFHLFGSLLITKLLELLLRGAEFIECARRGYKSKVFVQLDESYRFLKIQSVGTISCFSGIRRIELESCSRMHHGQVTGNFSATSRKFKELSFSVFYAVAGTEKTLDLIAPDKNAFDAWVHGLAFLLEGIKVNFQAASLHNRYLDYMFKYADRDNSGTLTKKEVFELTLYMSMHIAEDALEAAFITVDSHHRGALKPIEFERFLSLITQRNDLIPIWQSIMDGSFAQYSSCIPLNLVEATAPRAEDRMTVAQLSQFWQACQGSSLRDEFSSLDPEVAFESTGLSFNDFCDIMSTESNFIVNPRTHSVSQDMTQPLSHYFINSSHNTYLVGDQLTSKSSVKRYIDDLLNGVRCVELDTWDGPDGEPIITHGHTMTTTILLRDVAEAVGKYAFQSSPYPVILSVENHCSVEQQNVMATIFEDAFGDHLLPPDRRYEDESMMLLSPAELKGKILIKCSRHYDKTVDDAENDDADSEGEDIKDDHSSEVSANEFALDDTSQSERRSSHSNNERRPSVLDSLSPKKSSKTKSHERLSTVVYLSSHKVKRFVQAISADHIGSYSESKVKNGIDKHLFMDFNKSHLSRVYPAGYRIDSSNYNPLAGWSVGAHIVALNTQTPGIPLLLNFGLFRTNGGCGYNLKPEFMRIKDGIKKGPATLKINIISARNLPKEDKILKEVLCPSVEVQLHKADDKRDIQSLVHSTAIVKANGFNPIWNENFKFHIESPELSQISFHCYHSSSGLAPYLLASSSIPVSCLRSGFRLVQLYDVGGKALSHYAYAALFVQVEITY